MKSNEENEFLPVGSVVKIRLSKEYFVIVGFCPIEKETKKMYDYIAVRYPYGFAGQDSYTFFNKDVVRKVIKLGHESKEDKEFKVKLKESIEKRKKK